MSYPDDNGAMRFPSPDDPNSGFVDRSHDSNSNGYAIGHAAAPAPEGMTFVPSMGTWVDSDVAKSLGLGDPENNPTSLDAGGVPAGHDSTEYVQVEDMTDEDLEALQEQLEIRADKEPALSETLDAIETSVDPEVFSSAMNSMVDTGDFDATVATLSEAIGFDHQSTANLIEAVTMDATPIATQAIGADCWSSIMYAASATPDKFARQIVTEFVSGRLHPSKLARAYRLWHDSLPDAD